MKTHEYVLDPSDKWRPVGEYDGDYPQVFGVRTFVRDLVERRHGTDVRVWRDGAYQVRSRNERTKTFKGETAWSDAAREHGDRVTKARYAR